MPVSRKTEKRSGSGGWLSGALEGIQDQWLLVGILLLAALLRLVHASQANLWFDEAFAVLVARMPPRRILATVGRDVHPPVYFLMLHLWQQAVGGSELAVRSLSAFSSILAVATTFRLGTLAVNRRAGTWGALLMAAAPFQIYYAQEARAYALSVLVSASLLFTLLMVATAPSWRTCAAHALLAGLALYTHYFFALLLAAGHVWLFLTHQRWPVWRAVLVADVAAGLLFLPQVRLALSQALTLVQGFWIQDAAPLAVFKTLDFLLFASTTPTWLVPVALFGTLALLTVGARDLVAACRAGRLEGGPFCLVPVAAFVPLISAFLVSRLGPSIYLHRAFALLTPPFVLLLASALAIRPSGSPSLALAALVGLVAVVSLASFYLRPDPVRPDYRDVAARLSERGKPGDLLLHLHDSTSLPMRYYAPALESRILDHERHWLPAGAWASLGTHVPVTWTETLPPKTRLWVVVEPGRIDAEQQEVLESLRRNWTPMENVEPFGLHLWLFEHRAALGVDAKGLPILSTATGRLSGTEQPLTGLGRQYCIDRLRCSGDTPWTGGTVQGCLRGRSAGAHELPLPTLGWPSQVHGIHLAGCAARAFQCST